MVSLRNHFYTFMILHPVWDGQIERDRQRDRERETETETQRERETHREREQNIDFCLNCNCKRPEYEGKTEEDQRKKVKNVSFSK